jgi:hypothetical protein
VDLSRCGSRPMRIWPAAIRHRPAFQRRWAPRVVYGFSACNSGCRSTRTFDGRAP